MRDVARPVPAARELHDDLGALLARPRSAGRAGRRRERPAVLVVVGVVELAQSPT
jgi:hypothetical protein